MWSAVIAMIRVKCLAPKKARGEHEFEQFEDFARWVIRHTRKGKNVGPMCLALAEHGSWSESSVGFNIEASSDVKFDYFTLRDLAEKVAVLKTRYIRRDPYKRDPAVGLQFAKELDKLSSTQRGI